MYICPRSGSDAVEIVVACLYLVIPNLATNIAS